MAYCTRCGEPIDAGVEQYPSCGEPIESRSGEVADSTDLKLPDVAVPSTVYYGAAAGLVVGHGLFLVAASASLVYIGVAIVILSVLVLSFDYSKIRSHVDRRFSYAIRGVQLFLGVFVLSAVVVLSTRGMYVYGLPRFLLSFPIGRPVWLVLSRPIIRPLLFVGGLALAVSVVRLRQEQGEEQVE